MNVMKVVISVFKWLRGNRALTRFGRKFCDLLEEVDATYENLLLHTDIQKVKSRKLFATFSSTYEDSFFT